MVGPERIFYEIMSRIMKDYYKDPQYKYNLRRKQYPVDPSRNLFYYSDVFG